MNEYIKIINKEMDNDKIIILSTIYWGGIYSVLIAGLLGSSVSVLMFWKKIKLNT